MHSVLFKYLRKWINYLMIMDMMAKLMCAVKKLVGNMQIFFLQKACKKWSLGDSDI